MRKMALILALLCSFSFNSTAQSSDGPRISVRVSKTEYGLLWTAILLFESEKQLYDRSLLLAVVEPGEARGLSIETDRGKAFLVDGWERSFEIKRGNLIYRNNGSWFLLPQKPPYKIFDDARVIESLENAIAEGNRQVGWEFLSD